MNTKENAMRERNIINSDEANIILIIEKAFRSIHLILKPSCTEQESAPHKIPNRTQNIVYRIKPLFLLVAWLALGGVGS